MIRSLIQKRTRKSGFEDMFFVIAVIFTVVIFILILSKAWGEIEPNLDESLTNAMPASSSVNASETLDDVTSTTQLFDKLLPFLLIGLFGFVMLGAAIYANHPILIFVGVIIIAVAILLGVVYSNVYHQIADDSEFKPTTDNFPISDMYMKFLPYFLFIMAIGIGAMVMWLRKGGGTGTL